MPSLYYRVEATGVNVLNPVTEEIVTGLLDELDLLRYFKNSIYILSSFTAYSQYEDGEGVPTMIKNRCDVTVEYIMDKTQVPWPNDSPYTTPAYGIRSDQVGIHTPILIDPNARITIEHYTSACAISLSFSLKFRTFDDATKAFDSIKNRYVGSLIQNPFDIAFSYPVPMALYQYLFAVYKSKTDYVNKTIMDYINDMKIAQISFNVRKSQMNDPNADIELMIRNQQLNSVGQLTMDQKEPEVRRENQLPAGYELSFTFVIQFGRPTLIAVNTPVSVDNTLLPSYLFANVNGGNNNSPYVGGIYQDYTVNEFMKRGFGFYNSAHELVRIPEYDDWSYQDNIKVAYGYRPFVIAHFTLDGPTTIINIKQLDDMVLHPIVQQILSETGNDVFGYASLFNISIYAGNLLLGPTLLSLDNNLNLTITSNRTDLFYHLVISEATDLQKLDPKWNTDLIKYRYFFPMTIERNIQFLVEKKYFYIAYDNKTLNLILRLSALGVLKTILSAMIANGEDTNELYQYTQNASQLADYMAYTESQVTNYVIPTGTDAVSVMLQQYYNTYASIQGRSLLVVFFEQCLTLGYLTLSDIPPQYLNHSETAYPYVPQTQGGFYGFNTPLRVFEYTTVG